MSISEILTIFQQEIDKLQYITVLVTKVKSEENGNDFLYILNKQIRITLCSRKKKII